MPLSSERIAQITGSIGRSKVLVLGDIMLDEYLLGKVERISPEAPVPVVDIDDTKHLLGGAANVAANIRTLGDEPLLVGAVGDDDAAFKLRRLLSENDITSDYLILDQSRRTTIKTRIIAHGQQVVRADRETRHDLDTEIEQEAFSRIQAAIDKVAAVIISDYGKGVVTLSLIRKVVDLCLEKHVFIAVDPKESRFHNYRKVSLITPNHHEAGFAYGRRINSFDDLLEVGQGLLEKLQARAILITRGAEGMSLFQDHREPVHIPTFARQVYDITGAGDTVIATFVSAISAGATPVEAAIVANAGAGFTVGEVGTAAVTVTQLRQELERNIKNGNLVRAGYQTREQ